jgi:hypothetical protein
MNLSEFRKKFDAPIILILTILPIVYKAIKILFPSIPSFSSTESLLIYFSIILLAIFSFIERRLGLKKELNLINNFSSDLKLYLNKKHFKHIIIFAYNGHRYSTIFDECNIKVDKLTLFVRKPDNDSILYPIKNVRRFKDLSNGVLAVFQNLKKENIIKDLNIYYYDFDCFMFYLVADKEIAHFGLLKPNRDKDLGSTVLKSHLISNDNKEGIIMIKNFIEQSEALISEKLVEQIDE